MSIRQILLGLPPQRPSADMSRDGEKLALGTSDGEMMPRAGLTTMLKTLLPSSRTWNLETVGRFPPTVTSSARRRSASARSMLAVRSMTHRGFTRSSGEQNRDDNVGFAEGGARRPSELEDEGEPTLLLLPKRRRLHLERR
jgi:hypothetical protein